MNLLTRYPWIFGMAWLVFPTGLATAAGLRPLREFRDFAMVHEGNATNGRQLFANQARTGCANCHSVDGSSTKAGPDLFSAGDKFPRRELIQAVLEPSASIAEGYTATTIETRSGQEYTGIIKQVTEKAVGLMGGDGKILSISTSDILTQRTSDVSLMPEGLHSALTFQEFTDLIEYLATLRQPEVFAATKHGMPGDIPKLGRSVGLHAFFPEMLRFAHPVWFGAVPGQSNSFFLLEHESGKIWRLDKSGPEAKKSLFLDFGTFQKGTRGTIGMAIHPGFATNRQYYVAKHIVEDGHFSTQIFQLEAAPDLAVDSGKTPRLILKSPEDTNVHYGGGMVFGPDGYFYIGTGDSGPQEDPRGNGQNTRLLLGKMLRIDVDHPGASQPYSVPVDNPFVGRADFLPEIWAYGFREPWRFSFDSATGELWVGDVGQDRVEEVSIIRRGENLGWNVFEGFEPFSNRYRRETETFVPPVFAYRRKFGNSVTGGFVYRGDTNPSFYGVYVCGDFNSRRIFGLKQADRKLTVVRELGVAPENIVSFSRDEHKNLYLVGYDGMVYTMDFVGTRFED